MGPGGYRRLPLAEGPDETSQWRPRRPLLCGLEVLQVLQGLPGFCSTSTPAYGLADQHWQQSGSPRPRANFWSDHYFQQQLQPHHVEYMEGDVVQQDSPMSSDEEVFIQTGWQPKLSCLGVLAVLALLMAVGCIIVTVVPRGAALVWLDTTTTAPRPSGASMQPPNASHSGEDTGLRTSTTEYTEVDCTFKHFTPDDEPDSTGKRAWCCKHQGRGCIAPHGPQLYRCNDQLDDWQHAWSLGKQAWCCEAYGKGCPATSTTTPYDCRNATAGDSEWGAAKKAWCCTHHGRGCRDASLPLPATGIGHR